MTYQFLQAVTEKDENRMIIECVDMSDAFAEVEMNDNGGNPFPEECLEAKIRFLRARLAVIGSWVSLVQLVVHNDPPARRLYEMLQTNLKECEAKTGLFE